jgi:hypothetical protein
MPGLSGVADRAADCAFPSSQERGIPHRYATPSGPGTTANQRNWLVVQLQGTHHGSRQRPCHGVHLGAGTIDDAPRPPERDSAPDFPSRWGCLHNGADAVPLARTEGWSDCSGGWRGHHAFGWQGGRASGARTGMAIVDVSVTHPAGAANRAAAAANDGAAAAKRDGEKRRAYNQLEPNGYPFTPFSDETYGRLDKPATMLWCAPLCKEDR